MRIEVGSRVRHKAEFLRNIGCYTGSLPFARGTVKSLRPLGIATIEWDEHVPGNSDFDKSEVPERVHVGNLELIK